MHFIQTQKKLGLYVYDVRISQRELNPNNHELNSIIVVFYYFWDTFETFEIATNVAD